MTISGDRAKTEDVRKGLRVVSAEERREERREWGW
jgi:hypothetical protein